MNEYKHGHRPPSYCSIAVFCRRRGASPSSESWKMREALAVKRDPESGILEVALNRPKAWNPDGAFGFSAWGGMRLPSEASSQIFGLYGFLGVSAGGPWSDFELVRNRSPEAVTCGSHKPEALKLEPEIPSRAVHASSSVRPLSHSTSTGGAERLQPGHVGGLATMCLGESC